MAQKITIHKNGKVTPESITINLGDGVQWDTDDPNGFDVDFHGGSPFDHDKFNENSPNSGPAKQRGRFAYDAAAKGEAAADPQIIVQ